MAAGAGFAREDAGFEREIRELRDADMIRNDSAYFMHNVFSFNAAISACEKGC